MSGPLTDVKVLDFSTIVSGSVAARMLATIFDKESVNIETALKQPRPYWASMANGY